MDAKQTESRLCVVQFPHPGREPEVAGSVKPWNAGEHRRAFLESHAQYLKQIEGPAVDGRVQFWGEWEAEAEVKALPSEGEGRLPRYSFKPFYVPRASYLGVQNTDPFVFGDRFLYCCCKQFRGRPPRRTSLANLARGSILLFGSRLGSEFVLDTVFVVDEFVDYAVDATVFARATEWHAPLAFVDVSLRPLIATEVINCDPTVDDSEMSAEEEDASACMSRGGGVPPTLRLYFGATPTRAVQGMFSYAPCRPLREVAGSFARPTIEGGFITSALSQGFRLNDYARVEDVAAVWCAVTQAVLAKGLSLGVQFALPKGRSL